MYELIMLSYWTFGVHVLFESYMSILGLQAFKHMQGDVKPPGLWQTLRGVVSPVKTASSSSHQACTTAY